MNVQAVYVWPSDTPTAKMNMHSAAEGYPARDRLILFVSSFFFAVGDWSAVVADLRALYSVPPVRTGG